MCLAVLMLNVPLFLKLRDTVWAPITAWKAFHILFTAHSSFYMLNYWGILAVSHTLDYYRKYRERELRTSQLEARLAQAQLQVLKMQLHPHFLFNTLNAISALMHRDVEIADRMIARLGELLRLTLASAGAQEVPLKQELDFIKPYLEIEQARLGPRLQVITQIEPATLTALVPNLILQPLVENAVRHGIAPRAKAGRIEIRAYRAGDQLHLEVWDDGPGLTQAPPVNLKGGIGLANTRARLQQLYGPAHRFDLRNGDSRGLVVTLEIPFHEDPVQPENDRNGKAELPAAHQDCLVRS
jgi:LytS/YehU family sensor histidine kinase